MCMYIHVWYFVQGAYNDCLECQVAKEKVQSKEQRVLPSYLH